MERWIGRVVLVTGASAGMGAAIAERLAVLGMTVIGCARNITKIQECSDRLKGSAESKGRLQAIRCDLSKEGDILDMFKKIREQFGGVDVCVNCAGLSHKANLVDGETEKWRDILNVNVIAPSICSRETIKSLQERQLDDGYIIHINSISGHKVTPPDAHFYSASKHALTALTEGLRLELRQMNSHIRVSAVSPGVVETEFAYRMRGDEAAKKMYSAIKCMQPPDVADSVVYILSTPPHVQVHDILVRPVEQA